MPELPEVEVVRRGLDTHVLERTVESVEVFNPRAIRKHLPGEKDFATTVAGNKVVATHRRGKYLWLELDSQDGLVIHLGMSGQLLIQSNDAQLEKHARVVMQLSDGNQLRFVDQRTFGHMFLSRDGGGEPPEIAHIARDPLADDFDLAATIKDIQRRRSGIKRVLLDQRVISGIGNIYADEALWAAKINYDQSAETLSAQQIRLLIKEVTKVMNRALDQGGTSFDALYVNVNGESGYFDRSLNAYGQEGEPCSRCWTPIRRDKFMGRSSFWCPNCQLPD